MTPRLQTSTSGPLYFLSWNSLKAAYGELPQKVSNLEPGVISLLKPKSASFIFIFSSSNKFSAFRSRCTTCFWWQYWTADRMCLNLTSERTSLHSSCTSVLQSDSKRQLCKYRIVNHSNEMKAHNVMRHK